MDWLGSILPLNHLGHYIHWHFILISVSNLIVIGLMIVTFVAAFAFASVHGFWWRSWR